MMTRRVSFGPRNAYLSEDGSCFNSSFGGASIEGNMVVKEGAGRFSSEIFQGGCLKYEDSSKVLTSSMDFSTSNSSKLE